MMIIVGMIRVMKMTMMRNNLVELERETRDENPGEEG